MKFSRSLNLIRYYGQFIPINFQVLLLLLLVILSKRWVNLANSSTSSFHPMMLLMAKIAFVFILLVVCFSFFSALFCYLYFLLLRKKKPQDAIAVKADKDDTSQARLQLHTSLPFALRPFLGFVKVRLRYDHHLFTDKYIVSGRLKKQWIPFRSGLSGISKLLLPDIREYHFSEAIIYFEDMLRLFSFATRSEINSHVVNLPHSMLLKSEELPPKKTDEQLVRIEQLRKVEGEYLNYKKFEDSDDVRRIVWKIFARNKELVVRVPEVMDPFASHVYLYASFFHRHEGLPFDDFNSEMLNRMKSMVWTIYDALRQKEFDVRYISDQLPVHSKEEEPAVPLTITLSEWHQDRRLSEYFKPKTGSVLCIHSFTDPHDLENILGSCDEHTTIFFVELSKVFRSYYLFNWLLRIFFRPPADRLSALRNKWALHPYKFQTLKREKNLLSILRKYSIHLEVI